MDPTQTILNLIQADPLAVRRAFTDDRVLRALKAIGIGSSLPTPSLINKNAEMLSNVSAYRWANLTFSCTIEAPIHIQE